MNPANARVSEKEGITRLVGKLHFDKQKAKQLHYSFLELSKEQVEFLSPEELLEYNVWRGLNAASATCLANRRQISGNSNAYCVGS